MDQIQQFLHLQQALWHALRSDHPDLLALDLAAIPRSGRVNLGDEAWDFQRHGTGVLFIEVDGKRRVDLHDALAGADRIDAWRLATYFGGLGRAGDKIVTTAVGSANGTLHDRVHAWLEELCRAGVLIRHGTAYSLAPPQGGP